LSNDTTVSITYHLNGACIFSEQKQNRYILFLLSRHLIYELVLRSVFQSKLCDVAKRRNIPLLQDLGEKNENMSLLKIS
jgi:hypothetical protein